MIFADEAEDSIWQAFQIFEFFRSRITIAVRAYVRTYVVSVMYGAGGYLQKRVLYVMNE